MAGGRERAGEGRQVTAMLDVLGVRTRTAETELDEARDALVEAERYHGVCVRDVATENARLQAIIAHLRDPEVAASGSRYAETLAMRDVVARALGRERFLLDNADRALDAARDALAERRTELARMRARADALRGRLTTLARARERRSDLAVEDEAEELATLRRARPVGARA